eukprot:1717793-Lingulodinium_polyedra.AAC.1
MPARVVQEAFRNIGNACAHHSRETTHTLNAMVCAALAALEAQQDFLQASAQALKDGFTKAP